VAAATVPLTVTFTLSPALICGAAVGLASGVAAGAAGAGVAAFGFVAVFPLSVLADSQAVSASDNKAVAITFFIMSILR
jgi:hypothetical protein